ncbi:radical SAM protein, partial [bacterium]|nr:radical SAM protein [candidate division CSSED10-310 bacterium]
TLIRTAWHGLISPYIPIRPFGAVFMVTHRCNARCKMCNLWNTTEIDAPIETFVRLIEQPVFRDIVNVAVTGGELTLRSDLEPLFQALLRHCHRLDSINLSTNAFLPERLLDIVKNLVAARDAVGSTLTIIVQISLDGPGDIHDQIRGVRGGADRVQESVHRLQETFGPDRRVEIHHLCVLQPANIDHLDTIRAFFDRQTVPVTYNMICDASYLEVDPGTHPALTASMKDRLLAFFQDLTKRPDIDPRHRYHYREFIQWLTDGIRRKPCGMLSQHILIDHRGNIVPCMNAGNREYPRLLSPENAGALWRSESRRRINRELARNVCPGCTAACGPNTFDAILALILQKFRG